MEWNYVIFVLLGALGLFLMGAVAFRPLKILLKVGACLVVGMVLLVIMNIFLGMAGMHIAINPFTALLVGILHVPGVILLVFLNYLFL